MEYLDRCDEETGAQLWAVAEPFTYHSPRLGKDITVPVGFETDFASVPRAFWHLLPPTGKYGKASLVHDWLYTTKVADRLAADEVFRDAMAELGVPRLTRCVMFLAVRAFGSWRYGPCAGATA